MEGPDATAPAVDIDLDAKREQRGRHDRTVRLGGQIFTIPGGVRVDMLDQLDELRLKTGSNEVANVEVIKIIVGEENFHAMVAAGLELEDYPALLEEIQRLLGITLGKASTSPDSSEDSAGSSSLTSSASTA